MSFLGTPQNSFRFSQKGGPSKKTHTPICSFLKARQARQYSTHGSCQARVFRTSHTQSSQRQSAIAPKAKTSGWITSKLQALNGEIQYPLRKKQNAPYFSTSTSQHPTRPSWPLFQMEQWRVDELIGFRQPSFHHEEGGPSCEHKALENSLPKCLRHKPRQPNFLGYGGHWMSFQTVV